MDIKWTTPPKAILLTRADLSVFIVMLCDEPFKRLQAGEDETQVMGSVIAKLQQEGVQFESWRVITAADLPGGDEQTGAFDKTFRNAFHDGLPGHQVDIDMPKAKEIWKDKWREARKPLLQALDIEYQRADEEENTQLKKQIAAKKKALRDVTLTDLSQVNTPEELKAVWPDVLNEGELNA